MEATGSDTTMTSCGVPTNPKAARHVEYLTPVQLYKKRANDRSNQRISRARRKDRIKALEDENETLRSQLKALETAKGSASTLPSPTPSSPHTEQQQPRIWQVLPLWIPPMCRMDNVINRLTDNANEGSSYQELMGEITQLTYPSIPSLLNPESSPSSAPLTSVIGRHGKWMNITSPAAMTAMMYNICMYLRWLISPSKENYLALPAYLRPTPLQLILPHPRWIDMVPWPRAREQLITQMDWDKEFWTYRTHVNSTVSVNWPHPLSDILVSDNSDNIILSPQFLQHIHREVNWSVGPGLSEALPYLQCIPLHPK